MSTPLPSFPLHTRSPRAWRSKSAATSTSSFSFSSGASGDWNWAAGGGRTSSATTPSSFPTTVGFDAQQQALPALKVGSHHKVATSSLQSNGSPGYGEADGFFPRVAANASETAALGKQPASSGPDKWWAGSAESQMAWQPHLRIARRAPLPSPLASRGRADRTCRGHECVMEGGSAYLNLPSRFSASIVLSWCR